MHRVRRRAGIGDAIEVECFAVKHEIVEEEAAPARVVRLGEVRLAQEGDALSAIGAADEQPHRAARVRELSLAGDAAHRHRRRSGE